ncbi:MAG TPA: MFS transporter [Jatrophihabitantaceae bacterium]|jgi:EmrB/QacA subfamily drug resistance transporter
MNAETNAAAARPAEQSPAQPSGPSTGPDPRRWWTLGAVALGTFMLLLDITIVNVALPAIQQDLSSSFADLQWVVDAYALTLAATLLTAGSLADLYGRRRLYLIGVAWFTLASALCGSATNTLFLQLARGAQGVGGAIMFAVSLALLADAFRGKERGVAFGVWGAITGLAVAIGPLVGGALTSGLSWRWIFFVNLPIGAIAFVLTATRVRESRDPRPRRPDWWGFLTFTASLSLLVFALIRSGERGFTNSVVLGCYAGAAALMLTFVYIESVTPHPMFDLTLFRKPTFIGGAVAAFGVSATIFAMFLYLTIYVQDVLGYSPFATGIRLLTASAGIFAVAGISGRLSARVPIRLLIGPGLILVSVGLALMRGLDAGSKWTHLVPGLIVAGVGVGLLNPPLASTAVGVVREHQAGMASGINSTFRQVGIATGIALLGSLFASRVHSAAATDLARVPSLGAHTQQISAALTNGELQKSLTTLPAAQREPVAFAARAAFTTGMNDILLVASVTALVAGLLTLVLIRGKDFVQTQYGPPPE